MVSLKSYGGVIRHRLAAAFVAVALLVGLVAGAAGRGLLPGGTTAAALAPTAAFASVPAAADLQTALVSVAQQVGPAVVSVRTDSGLGSGVIYDASGLVLTNAHVVDGARTVSVGLADGRRFSGRILGTDAGFDI